MGSPMSRFNDGGDLSRYSCNIRYPQRGPAGTVGFDLSGVQLLCSPEFYELRCASNIGVRLAQRGHSTAPHSPVSSRRHISRKELEGFCFRAKLAYRLDAELAVQRDETISDQDFCYSDVQFHRLIVDACGNDVVRLASTPPSKR